jgi:hypothetical protein
MIAYHGSAGDRCTAGLRSNQYPSRVNLGTYGRGDAAIHVRYAFNSDQGGAWQRNVASCRLCCKSRKLLGDKFPARRQTNRRSPIWVASITLPKSPVSSSSGDEVPHIFTRKSRLQPGEFLITSAKGLLQQYLPFATQCTAASNCPIRSRRRGASSVGGTVSPIAFSVLTLKTRSNPAYAGVQTFPLQPEFSACEIDRGGKRAFNIRAASLSFTLLFPNLLISRLA